MANPMDSIRTEQRDGELFVIHQVEEDETLYSIARRYGGSVAGIVKHNDLEDNHIDIGQIIQVLVEKKDDVSNVAEQTPTGVHVVEKGETLYSISKQYEVKLRDLRDWNNLDNNDISLGMTLRVAETAPEVLYGHDIIDPIDSLRTDVNEVTIDSAEIENAYEKYLVQTGETLYTIASKIGVSLDSLRIWNEMESDFLQIGQELLYRGVAPDSVQRVTEPRKKIRTQIDENGFEKFFEEGVASVIEEMETSKYLALHRTLPIGTKLEVRNLMNNQVVHVKVVGLLPNTGLNKNLLLRLSQPAYDQLGILDSRSRVEVSFYKN